MQVRDALVAACQKRGVTIRYGASLEGLERHTAPQTQRPHGPRSAQDHSSIGGPHGSTSAHTETVGGGSGSGRVGEGADMGPGWVCRLGDGSTHHTDRLVRSDVYTQTHTHIHTHNVHTQNTHIHTHTQVQSALPFRRVYIHVLYVCWLYAQVLATGGLSFPAVGTDGTGHRILKRLGVPLIDTYPGVCHRNCEDLIGPILS